MMLRKFGFGLSLLAALAVPQVNAVAQEKTPTSPTASGTQSQNNNIEAMAGIVMSMNHFPGKAETNTLNQIASTAQSDAEKTIANAILNIKHAPAPADKAKLELIAADPNAAAPVRDLASIVADFNHQVTEADVARLKHIK